MYATQKKIALQVGHGGKGGESENERVWENNKPGVGRKDQSNSAVGCADSQICIEGKVFMKKINLRSA